MKAGISGKNNILIIAAGLMFLVTLFNSCYYDEIAPEPEKVVAGGVSFTDDILPIFTAECSISGCHNAGGTAPNLSSGAAYNSLINGNYINTSAPVDSELYQWMLGNRDLDMPLSGPNSYYNALVLQWITEGAKNN